MSLQTRIVSFELESARNARRKWSRRPALGLEVQSPHGIAGWGEASPLPGFSSETLAEALHVLEVWRHNSPSVDLTASSESEVLLRIDEHVRELPVAVPSARFAVESALLDIASQQRAIAAHQLLGSSRRSSPIALAMLAGSAVSLDSRVIAEALEAGFETIKVKIGASGEFKREVGALKKLRKMVGRKVRLRVDANGGLGASLGEKLARLAEVGLEMVEEPVSGARLIALGPRSVPIAIDETLVEVVQEKIRMEELADSAIEVVILKPMLLGGLIACRQLAVEANQRGARCVVSHLFDGPIAMAGYCALASSLPSQGLAMGLAKHAGLATFDEVVAVDGLGDVELRQSSVPGLPLVWKESC